MPRRLYAGSWVEFAPTTSIIYDQANRLTSITHELATDIVHAYAYDNASRTTNFNSTGSGGASRSFGYDEAGQLTSKTGGTDESYTYDDNGNRTFVGRQAITTVFDNRLRSDGTFNYFYDSEGNLTTRTRISTAAANDYLTEYGWDYRNRLTGVTFKNNAGAVTKSVGYSYDAEDRRVKRALDSNGGAAGGLSNEYFVYDGSDLALRFGNGQEFTHRYQYGPLTDQVLIDEVFGEGAGSGERGTDDVLWQLADQ